MGNEILNLTWEWEEEIFNEATEEYEILDKSVEVEVLITIEFGRCYVDIQDEDGDELPENELEKLMEYAMNYSN